MSVNARRRQLLLAAARLPALLIATGSVRFAVAGESPAPPPLTTHESETLQRIAWLLFPFKGLGQEPYRAVVATLATQPGKQEIISNGVAALDELAGGRFLERAEAEQVALLEEMESGEFFPVALEGTRGTLFRDPRLWALIGYEGSSLEFGGYLGRGLEDIDWLPEFEDPERDGHG